MSLAAQAKVLRALEEGQVTRVGGQRARDVDVRVVSATNKDPATEIEEGRFREDLFYRLNVVPTHIPPLRDRREDIPVLVSHFVAMMTERDGLPARELTREAVSRLQDLEWPGNARELRNTVERLLILSPSDRITSSDVDALVAGGNEDAGLGSELMCSGRFQDFKDRSERLFLLRKLREFDWNVSETARALDMPRSNLYKKIEKFSLKREG